jgi:hypothetical protein
VKYCPNCGSENVKLAKFCISCGTEFLQDHTSPDSTESSTLIDQKESPPTGYSPTITTQPAFYVSQEVKEIRLSSGVNTFSMASLIFALIPLLLIVVSFIVPDDSFNFIFTILGLLAMPVFTFGLYSFVKEITGDFKDQGNTIVRFLTLYIFLDSAYMVGMYFFIPSLPENPATTILEIYITSVLISIILGFIPTALFLFTAIKFNDWFNQVVSFLRIVTSTSRFKWIGFLNTLEYGIQALWLLIAIAVIGEVLPEEINSLIIPLFYARIFLPLVVVIMQILAGIKIYSILTEGKQLY